MYELYVLTVYHFSQVVFPPASLEIDQFPTYPVAGHSMSLTCTTSSSNPPSRISWYDFQNNRIEFMSKLW